MSYLENIGIRSKTASTAMNILSTKDKDRGLKAVAEALLKAEPEIITANDIDIKNAYENNMKESLIDRLRLNHERIAGMSEGLQQLTELKNPIGEVLSSEVLHNGLKIEKRRVPMGVIGIIYESRPNVTADAFGLCFKSGNAVILRGGSDAIHSNQAIVAVIRKALSETGLLEDAVILLENTSREMVREFMRLKQYVDLLIPRGGAGLIQSVLENSTIPVIETGVGNCHIFVDESADLEMAEKIIINAKTQRLGVCNACESLLIHVKIAPVAVPAIAEVLKEKGVEIRGCERTLNICKEITAAKEEDWGTEYLDAIISLKLVENVEEAISHINKYNTHHSEAIITENAHNAEKFLNEVDAAAVYVNSSTRFTDGFEFGFGAEMGISTQKLHVRGPMGLEALTSTKYVVYGEGQIREI